MATLETSFLHDQLEERKRRLQAAIAVAPPNAGLAGLLHEVDSALARMAKGSTVYAKSATNRWNRTACRPTR
jgi:hypothetical protein